MREVFAIIGPFQTSLLSLPLGSPCDRDCSRVVNACVWLEKRYAHLERVRVIDCGHREIIYIYVSQIYIFRNPIVDLNTLTDIQ